MPVPRRREQPLLQPRPRPCSAPRSTRLAAVGPTAGQEVSYDPRFAWDVYPWGHGPDLNDGLRFSDQECRIAEDCPSSGEAAGSSGRALEVPPAATARSDRSDRRFGGDRRRRAGVQHPENSDERCPEMRRRTSLIPTSAAQTWWCVPQGAARPDPAQRTPGDSPNPPLASGRWRVVARPPALGGLVGWWVWGLLWRGGLSGCPPQARPVQAVSVSGPGGVPFDPRRVPTHSCPGLLAGTCFEGTPSPWPACCAIAPHTSA